YCGLCSVLSIEQDLARTGAPTAGRWRRQRRLAADGRQAALYSCLSEDESATNDARPAMRAESTPDQLLDSSLVPGLAARLSAPFQNECPSFGARFEATMGDLLMAIAIGFARGCLPCVVPYRATGLSSH